MGFCFNCGYQLDEGIRFCPRCGAGVVESSTPNNNINESYLKQAVGYGGDKIYHPEMEANTSDAINQKNNNMNSAGPNVGNTDKKTKTGTNEYISADGLKHIPYTPKKKGSVLPDTFNIRETPLMGIVLLVLATVILGISPSILSFILSLVVVTAAIICVIKNVKWKFISFISIAVSVICIVFNAVIVGSNIFIVLFGEDPLNISSVYFNKKNGIDEEIVYDNNGVRITASGIKYNDSEVQLELLFENTERDMKHIMAGTAGCPFNSVNGYMVPGGYINYDLYPGQEQLGVVKFSYQELMMAGINRISNIGMVFEVDGDSGSIYTGPVLIETKSGNHSGKNKGGYVKAIKSKLLQKAYGYTIDYLSSEEIYNENGVAIVSEMIMTNKDGERMLLLETRNDTDSILAVRSREIKINGSMAYEYVWDGIGLLPGCTGVMDISLDDIIDYGDWEGNKDNIEDIEVTIEVGDSYGNHLGTPSEVKIDLK